MSLITKSARNEPCLVRIDGICSFDPSTTVLAHIGGAGIGRKKSDLYGAYCCHSCHDAIDGRVQTGFSKAELELMHRQGVERTQDKLLEKRLIILA